MPDDDSSPQAVDRRPENDGNSASTMPPEASNEESPRARLSNRTYAQTKRKSEFVHHIITNVDKLIYAELCILYYMDCSFFRLAIRAMTQVTFLTPNPEFVQSLSKHRPYVPMIFGTNAFCILLHLLTSRPEAGESTRGYLHGGIIIDLIGQKGPTSKIVLVLLDLLVMILQFFMLAVHVEQERLKATLASSGQITRVVTAVTSSIGGASPSPDQGAQERVDVRNAGMGSDDIEMQQISSSRIATELQHDNAEEQDQLLAERTRRAGGEVDDGPLDLFYSGNMIISDFHVLHTLRSQWEDRGNAAETALYTVGYTANHEWTRVQRRVRRRLDTLR